MKLLALHTVGHDACAAVFDGGRLLVAIEAERLTRVKHDHRVELALRWCLEQSRFAPGDIDLVAVSTPVRAELMGIDDLDAAMRRIEAGALHYRTKCRLLGRETDCVIVTHEVSHAALTAHYAGWTDGTLILTNEGRGQRGRSSLFLLRGGRLEWLEVDPLPWYGTGFGWSAIGHLYGFGKGPSVAGKVMAVGGYGSPSAAVADLFRAIPDRVMHDRAYAGQVAVELAGRPELRGGFSAMADAVAAFQGLFTDAVVQLVTAHARLLGCGSVALGGGCALNLNTNTALRRALGHDVAIPPACNDAGQALGVGVYALKLVAGSDPEPFSVYSNGVAEPREAIISALCRAALVPVEADPAVLGRALAEGAVVAVLDGAGELGPRALGNRSLLASPAIRGIRERVSERLKGREWFRPLGAVMRLQRFRERFPSELPSPYMLHSFCAPGDDFTGATHVDGTSRIQTLAEEDHPRLHRVLHAFEAVSGVPALINTSLNRRDLAIAGTAQHALDDFLGSDVDLFWFHDVMALNRRREGKPRAAWTAAATAGAAALASGTECAG